MNENEVDQPGWTKEILVSGKVGLQNGLFRGMLTVFRFGQTRAADGCEGEYAPGMDWSSLQSATR